MSTKRKVKGQTKAPEAKKVQIKYEEIDPNNQLKADCGSEQHDEIINIPHSFVSAGSNIRRRQNSVSATGQKLPRIGSRGDGLAQVADHPILNKMKRDLKRFGEGSLLGEMQEATQSPKQNRGYNSKSVVRAAQELSGLDGGFEVFLNDNHKKGRNNNQNYEKLVRTLGRPLASHTASKGSPVLKLIEREHIKIKQNLAKATFNHDHNSSLPDPKQSQTKSKEHLLSSINEDATKATQMSLAKSKTIISKTEDQSRISIPTDNQTVKYASPVKTTKASPDSRSPSMSLKLNALAASESKKTIGGISSLATGKQKNELQKYIKQQQYFRDTHTSRTANSKEGRRLAFVKYQQQLNEKTADRHHEYSQPSVGDVAAADSSRVIQTVKEEQGSDRYESQVLQGRDEITVKGSIIGSRSGSLHQTPQVRAKKTHFQYRNRSVIPFVPGETPSGTIQPENFTNEPLEGYNSQMHLARKTEIIARAIRSQNFGKQFIDNTTDFDSFNKSALKSIKNEKLERRSQNIEQVHARLMEIKQVSNQSADLRRIHKSLSPFFRDFYLKSQRHSALIGDMNYLNSCFIDIIDYACSYRIELGNTLQRLVEAYNSIFLQQFQTFYDNKLQKEKELDQALIDHKEEIRKLDEKKLWVEDERKLRAMLLADKEVEIKALRESQGSLEQQIDDLQKMLHKAELDEKELSKDLKDNKEKLSKGKKEQGLNMEDNYTAQQRNILAKQFQNNQQVLFNPAYDKDFAVALQTVDEEMDDKRVVLREMQTVFRKLMKNNSTNRSIQTEEAIWNDLPQRLKYHHSNAGSSDHGDEVDSQDTEHRAMKKQQARDAKFETMKQERNIVLNEESQIPQDVPNNLSQAQESGAERTGDASIHSNQKSSTKTIVQQHVSQSSQAHVSENQGNQLTVVNNKGPGLIDDPQISYNKSLRQVGLRSPGQLQVLHDQFMDICNTIRKKHTDASKAISRQNRGEWKIPYTIVAFCANRIKELNSKPENVQNWELMPWKKFKNLIYTIYKHRIEHAPEINGISNLNYCCMNEHVLIYFIDLLKNRDEAEQKLVEVIINLRYYCDHWLRARTFAANLQLIHSEPEKSVILTKDSDQESIEQQTKPDEYGDDKADNADDPPQGLTGDSMVPENDLYVQEFFLHCFATLISIEDQLQETSKGGSYLRVQDHDRFAKQLIGTLRGPSGNLTRWKHKMKALITRIPIEGLEIEFLDIDQVLGALMTEFKDQKKSYQNRLKKEFVTKMEGYTAPCNLDEFREIIEMSEMGRHDEDSHIDPLINFAGPMSEIRAFIFCVTSGISNTSTFSNEQFIAGLARYGVENPTPCVSKRFGMYGNSEDMMRALIRAEGTYGKLRMRIHTKRYSGAKDVAPKARFGSVTRINQNEIKNKEIEDKEKQPEEKENQSDDKQKQSEDKEEQPEDKQQENLIKLPDASSKELKPFAHQEKIASITNMRFDLVEAMNAKSKGFDPRQEAENLEGDREANKYFVYRGATIKVQNLKDFRTNNATELQKKLNPNQKEQKNKLKKEKIPEAEKEDSASEDIDASLLKLEPQVSQFHSYNQNKVDTKTGSVLEPIQDLTKIQYAMSHKQIIVPTMGSLGTVFSQHLSILQNLRDRIGDLQQAYFEQKDPERSWKEVDLILLLLRNGSKFLDFPEDMVLEASKDTRPKHISLINVDDDNEQNEIGIEDEDEKQDSSQEKQVKFGKNLDVSDAESFKSKFSEKQKPQLVIKDSNQDYEDSAPAFKKQSKRSKKIISDSDDD